MHARAPRAREFARVRKLFEVRFARAAARSTLRAAAMFHYEPSLEEELRLRPRRAGDVGLGFLGHRDFSDEAAAHRREVEARRPPDYLLRNARMASVRRRQLLIQRRARSSRSCPASDAPANTHTPTRPAAWTRAAAARPPTAPTSRLRATRPPPPPRFPSDCTAASDARLLTSTSCMLSVKEPPLKLRLREGRLRWWLPRPAGAAWSRRRSVTQRWLS